MNSSNLVDLTARAIGRRLPLISEFEGLRLIDGAGDGCPGLYLDRFGPLAVAHLLSADDYAALPRLQPQLEQIGVRTLYRYRHPKDARSRSVNQGELVFGSNASQVIVHEFGVAYAVRPSEHFSAGLFLDARELRRELRQSAKGKRVLNLFCFTGSIGLAAWSSGAEEVVQVDISKAALSWARDNLQLNDALAAGEMRFIPEDSRRFIDKESRRVERGTRRMYDLIVIDPPSFGSSAGQPFVLLQEFPMLMERCLNLLAEGGDLFCTCNLGALSAEDVARRIEDACESCGVSAEHIERLLPPAVDFTAPPHDSIGLRGAVARRIRRK